ncbi:hypothetical protein [uncultured Sphingobium sp.]|uniref:hypothetical protein n=1 Tax=uncultured Sphingobium sp. TaxID=316087 RepID=UPI00259B8248|nr:hypothetical protein [uncultured Sphingobium sp.]
MNVGKILISIARFGWKKIVKPAAVEYGPEILADAVKGRNKPRREKQGSPEEPSD